jgi:hypothetical protein
MKIADQLLSPVVLGEVSFVDLAKQHYRRFSKIPFEEDLADYLRNGIVVSRQTGFGMAKLVMLDGQYTWFVRFAIGDLRELISCLPWTVKWIAFCRRDKEIIHRWPLKRLVELTYRRK